MSLSELSIVVPTWNCRQLLEPVAEQMRGVYGSAGEIVVVDSESEDGTLDLLREIFAEKNATFLSRPRGLYQSWNDAISACTLPWVNVATAGDVITEAELRYLFEVAEKQEVDVVVGTPRFVSESGESLPDLDWPVFGVFDTSDEEEVVVLADDDLLALATYGCRPGNFEGWLGSSASNLYRGDFLKSHPFPTDVGPIGDALWGLRYAKSLRAAFCARRCGRFVVHEKQHSFSPNEEPTIHGTFEEEWTKAIQVLLGSGSSSEIQANSWRAYLLKTLETQKIEAEKARRLSRRVAALREVRQYYVDCRKRLPKMIEGLVFPQRDRE